MSEYINLNDAKAKIRKKFKDLAMRIEINEVLNSLPIIESRPKGEWELPSQIERHFARVYDKQLYNYRCSECSFEINLDGTIDPEESIKAYRYCPHCGAEMRWK